MKIWQTGVLWLLIPTLLHATDWGVESSPGVVNPATRSEYQETLSLAGEWDFQTGVPAFRIRLGDGIWGNPGWDFSKGQKIQVPGIWETQGVGEMGPGTTWDCLWDCGQWILRHGYLGNAAYQKIVEIPADWQGKKIFLKVGGVRTEAYFWINGCRAAYVNNYCATEKFDITPFLKSGENNRIQAYVRNDTPSRKGLLAVNHRFGGFYRDLELEAVPEIFVDDAWVESDFPNRSVIVRLILAGEGKTIVRVEIQTRDGKTITTRQETVTLPENRAWKTTIPIPDCQFWTPEVPFLYHAVVTLLDEKGKPLHGWCERFGIREFKVVGKQFYLNGKPYFLRGAGDHNYDSLLLVEPPCRERFVEHMKIYKAAGFNAIRHHTHCPLPEYFEAADEMGLLLQPELPYYHDVPTEGFVFDPMRDLRELYQTCRRHPSFAIYCTGNEGHLGSPLDEKMYQWVKANDPSRLMLHQDGGRNTPENSDFSTGEIKPWKIGTFDSWERPFVAHEYLNLAIKLDPELEPRFTGVRVIPPMLARQKALLEACGLEKRWGKACVAAAERLQAIYQKQGLESARQDPACDGYSFWSLIDAGALQGEIPVSQGYLNPFWEPRPNGWQPEAFARFNGPSILLLKADRECPIATSGEKLICEFQISHFDYETLPAGTLTWQLGSLSGKLPVGEIPTGFVGTLGKVEITVPSVEIPETTELLITSGKLQNSWKWRIFPARKEISLNDCHISPELWEFFQNHFTDILPYQSGNLQAGETLVVLSTEEDILVEAITAGCRILVISPTSEEPDVQLGWWSLGTQIGTAIGNHPLWETFPTEAWMDELWFRLIRKGGHDLRAPTPLGRLTPLVVGEGRDSYSLYLGEGNIGKSHVLATFAVALLQGTPEALCLLEESVRYLQKGNFASCATISEKLFQVTLPPDTVLGFEKKLSAEEEGFWPTWYSENGRQWICRQSQKGNELLWETAIDNSSRESVTFVWGGGLGYYSQPKTEGFELLLNGKRLLTLDVPYVEQEKNVLWKSNDGKSQLRFEILRVLYPGPDYCGRFFLTVPANLLKPGEKQQLAVRSLGEKSLRWLALYPHKNLSAEIP